MILEKMNEAIKNDGFLLIGITGERGRGKSVLGLNLLYSVLKNWDLVLRHTIFTLQDFENIRYRDDLDRTEDGRVSIILWDDFALHTSSYAFLRGEGEKVGEFIENFEVVREDLAVLVITCATWDLVPPKIRTAPKIIINMQKLGVGHILEKDEENPANWLKRVFRLGGKIRSEKIPQEIYNEYRKLKREAISVKREIANLRKEEEAEKLAEKLTAEDWNNLVYLKALGIYDLYGNITQFGQVVRKKWGEKMQNSATQNGSDVLNKFRKIVTQNDFERLAYSVGVKRESARALYKLVLERISKKSGEEGVILDDGFGVDRADNSGLATAQ